MNEQSLKDIEDLGKSLKDSHEAMLKGIRSIESIKDEAVKTGQMSEEDLSRLDNELEKVRKQTKELEKIRKEK